MAQISFCIEKQAEIFNLEPALIWAIIHHETIGKYDQYSFRCEPKLRDTQWYIKILSKSEYDVIGNYCSLGLMHVLFGTVKSMGFNRDYKDLFDINTNIYWGSRYLYSLTKRYPWHEVFDRMKSAEVGAEQWRSNKRCHI